ALQRDCPRAARSNGGPVNPHPGRAAPPPAVAGGRTMSSKDLISIKPHFAGPQTLDEAGYLRLYNESIQDEEAFWRREGQRLDWIKPYSQVKDCSFAADDLHIRWFADGQLNVAANCL